VIQPPDLTVLTEAKSASRRARLLGDTERSILVLRGGDAGDPWDPGSLLLEKVKRLEKTSSDPPFTAEAEGGGSVRDEREAELVLERG
jgi:hypothetical protein